MSEKEDRREERAQKQAETDLRVRNVMSLLAAGLTPDEVRTKLNLTRRQFRHAATILRSRSEDSADVWSHYKAKTALRLAHLETIRKKAMETGKLDHARKAVKDLNAMDRQIIEVGVLLGKYEAKPKELRITDFRLGAIHELEKDMDAKIVEDDETPTRH